jgi:hypothetical protein
MVHWLPKPAFRGLMRRTSNGFFAEEANLNLIGVGELKAIARDALPDGQHRIAVGSVALGGWPSNLLLSATRTARP